MEDKFAEVLRRTAPKLPEAEEAAKAKTAEEAAAKAAREAKIQELAKDPAQGNRVTPKTLREAEVGQSSVENGTIPGPIRRDPSGAAEFIDAKNQAWDVKAPNSNFPPEKGGFELSKDFGKIQNEVAKGENVIVDTENMSPGHLASLKSAVTKAGLDGKVVFFP